MKTELSKYLAHTYAEMERLARYGSISERLYRAWLYVWNWATFRYSGEAGRVQDIYWHRHGKVAFYAKINRCRVAFGFEPYAIPA